MFVLKSYSTSLIVFSSFILSACLAIDILIVIIYYIYFRSTERSLVKRSNSSLYKIIAKEFIHLIHIEHILNCLIAPVWVYFFIQILLPIYGRVR